MAGVSMTATIPAECIPQLGGMQRTDSSVIVTDGTTVWSVHPIAQFHAPLDITACRLRVEQSAPTLERVLARHLEWDGSRRVELRVWSSGIDGGRLRWQLASVNKRGEGERWWRWLPAHISTDLDYLEALAEAVVWHARVARVGLPHADAGLRSDTPSSVTHSEALALVEQSHNLPTWAVQR